MVELPGTDQPSITRVFPFEEITLGPDQEEMSAALIGVKNISRKIAIALILFSRIGCICYTLNYMGGLLVLQSSALMKIRPLGAFSFSLDKNAPNFS
tara:strand:- start:60 stop:350 length:291 start_codon:yes stop_codon:yes gene_type:complete